MNTQIKTIALDYGGYAVAVVLPQLPLRVPGRARWLPRRRAGQATASFPVPVAEPAS